MKRCPPPAARSSWPWATTASSRSWPPRWARELARDPRYAANADRLANRQSLRDALSALLATHEAAALADRLLRAGVPAAVQTVDQALAHPHTRHRGMLLEQGDYRGVGSPIKLSRTPARLRRLPPALGGLEPEAG